MESSILSMVNDTKSGQLFNQTISLAELSQRPGESFQLSEDRTTTEAYHLYHDFLNAFQSSLDEDSTLGTLESYATMADECGSMLSELARQLTMAGRQVPDLKTLAESIQLESRTWRLLEFIVRVKENENDEMDFDGTAELNMFSEKLASGDFHKHSDELQHLEAVIDWLESNAVTNENYYAGSSNMENTLHNIKMGKSQVNLNPDCAVKELHVLDRQEMQKLNSEIYRLLRAGQVAESVRRCVETGQAWKAAMIEGHILYHAPSLIGREEEEEGVEARDLWKAAANAYSSSPNQSLLDRAAIGALCGNSEPLLQIATSWEDRLWALLKGYVDVAMEEHIRSATIGERVDLPSAYWKQKQPIESLLQKASATVTSGSIHRKIQELLIENDFGTLAQFVEQTEAQTKHEARFLAHLSIVLQQLSIETSTKPIEHYARRIASEANPEFNARGDALLVAAYAQQLRQDEATACYAQLLTALSAMNEENRDFLIQLAEKNGLDVFAITHQTASNLQLVENNESTAFDILLVNKRIEESIELACKMIRNMILLERDQEAKRAIAKLIDAGALTVKNNEIFLLIKAHLEALDIFFEWSQLEQRRPQGEAEKPDVNATRSFMKRIQIEKEWESKLADELKWKREMKEKALLLKNKVLMILASSSKWMDAQAKSSCIPRLVISSLKALIGAEEYEHCVDVVNALFAPGNGLEECLNTQNTPDILTLTTLAASRLLEQGKTF